MIVADVNLLIYLCVAGPFTDAAERALQRDGEWIAPAVCNYETLNVLATHVRTNRLRIDQAVDVMNRVFRTVRIVPDSDRQEVLRTSIATGIGSYDCEYIVLERDFLTRVVTADKKMLAAFPDLAVSLEAFANGA